MKVLNGVVVLIIYSLIIIGCHKAGEKIGNIISDKLL